MTDRKKIPIHVGIKKFKKVMEQLDNAYKDMSIYPEVESFSREVNENNLPGDIDKREFIQERQIGYVTVSPPDKCVVFNNKHLPEEFKLLLFQGISSTINKFVFENLMTELCVDLNKEDKEYIIGERKKYLYIQKTYWDKARTLGGNFDIKHPPSHKEITNFSKEVSRLFETHSNDKKVIDAMQTCMVFFAMIERSLFTF